MALKDATVKWHACVEKGAPDFTVEAISRPFQTRTSDWIKRSVPTQRLDVSFGSFQALTLSTIFLAACSHTACSFFPKGKYCQALSDCPLGSPQEQAYDTTDCLPYGPIDVYAMSQSIDAHQSGSTIW